MIEQLLVGVCGTYAGDQRHRKEGEPSCEPCRAARAEYQRQYRATHDRPDDRLKARAIGRARTRLVHAHLAEYHQFYEEELLAARKRLGP